jgi:hypothetical protein
MSTTDFVSPRHRRLPLSAALAAAVGVAVTSGSVVRAESASWAPDFHPVQERIGSERPFRFRPATPHASPKSNPDHPAALHIVKNCLDDGGPDTLRSQIAAAGPNETVDLSQLMCSKITLAGHHALEIHQDDLTLKGPAAGAASLTISAGLQSAVIYHSGGGTLSIVDLTISDGIFVGSNKPRGGCIYSAANVYLSRSVVSQCHLQSTQQISPALGGAVFTQADLTLRSSTITDSAITDAGSGAVARGGGAYVYGNFASNTSTISGNFSFLQGGGVFVGGDVEIHDSTISGNVAGRAFGALEVVNSGHAVEISNSTISDNHARNNYGAYYGGIWSASPVTITSSTIAFNSAQSTQVGEGEGLHLYYASASIKSSIIAGNFNELGPADIGGFGASLTQDSANNLITSSSTPVPFDTIKDCPKLDALADTGNFGVKTHGLLPTSPAIDQGNSGFADDERGKPRHIGAGDDIGAFERQPTDIADRIHISGFDGICDG